MKGFFISRLTISVMCFLFFFSNCKRKTDPEAVNQFLQNQVPEWNHKLTQVIISDIFTPAVCSRIYAYTNIAAYEVLRHQDQTYGSYSGKLNGLPPLPKPKQGIKYNYDISGVIAFTTVAEKLVFNGDAIKEMEKAFIDQLNKINVNEEELNVSILYGREVGNHINAWASKDGYLERTSYPAYTVTREAGRYQPTPPNYIDAVETNWNTLRPFVLDSASQFRPPPPTKYDTAKESQFYKDAFQVYDLIKNPHEGDSATAWYWDDNPNTSITNGHITYFQQKNSPPGHWINIACSVAENEHFSPLKTASLISKTAIAIADAFISAWEAKYVYNYIRPETFITTYIDKDWVPLIQTPAFPEYPSAHSVASSSAAAVLSNMVGDDYVFIDSTEVPYGRPTRRFDSFRQAADEASISRLYGGIHFLPAIEKGKEQGRKIGNHIISKLK